MDAHRIGDADDTARPGAEPGSIRPAAAGQDESVALWDRPASWVGTDSVPETETETTSELEIVAPENVRTAATGTAEADRPDGIVRATGRSPRTVLAGTLVLTVAVVAALLLTRGSAHPAGTTAGRSVSGYGPGADSTRGGDPKAPQTAHSSSASAPSVTTTVTTEGVPVLVLAPSHGSDKESSQPSATTTPTTVRSAGAGTSAPASPPSTVGSGNGTSTAIHATAVLQKGQSVRGGSTTLTLTDRGDLELLDGAGKITWSSRTTGSGDEAVFQSDGNMVVYNADSVGVWSSGTSGNDGAVLVIEGDGNLVINNRGTTLWQTHTGR
ncbi:hypothetical protein ABT255_47725 [Streptomyces mirabilis]|uniref:hypothetical protein n=1 Tax=Streptomyces mirabilis TaxID=68239 RepID=UPI0033273CF8